MATVGPPFAPTLAAEYAEVEKAVRLRYSDNVVFKAGEHQYYENDVIYADKDFFHLFSFPLAEGDPNSALAEPNSIVLTPEMTKEIEEIASTLSKLELQSMFLSKISKTTSGIKCTISTNNIPAMEGNSPTTPSNKSSSPSPSTPINSKPSSLPSSKSTNHASSIKTKAEESPSFN